MIDELIAALDARKGELPGDLHGQLAALAGDAKADRDSTRAASTELGEKLRSAEAARDRVAAERDRAAAERDQFAQAAQDRADKLAEAVEARDSARAKVEQSRAVIQAQRSRIEAAGEELAAHIGAAEESARLRRVLIDLAQRLRSWLGEDAGARADLIAARRAEAEAKQAELEAAEAAFGPD